MTHIYHENESRGLADHGWLVSRHTFSFANYYNPERMNFGALRVINDDIVKPAMGFGTHPHDNMEIVSIPLSGALRHKDSMGNEHIISAGEVQIMSAGSGLTHSEYNASSSDDVNFLQIWVLPKVRDIAPRYGQKSFDVGSMKNNLQLLVSPEKAENTIWINQEAWFSMGDIEQGKRLRYTKYNSASVVYFFLIEGDAQIEGHHLQRRDGLGVNGGTSLVAKALSDSRLLVMEVPAEG